jgi:hypothetical protein
MPPVKIKRAFSFTSEQTRGSSEKIIKQNNKGLAVVLRVTTARLKKESAWGSTSERLT